MSVKLTAHVNDPVAYGKGENKSDEELLEEARENLVVENCEPEFYVDEVTAEGEWDGQKVVYAHRITAEGETRKEVKQKIEKAIKENKAQSKDSILREKPNLYYLPHEEVSFEFEDKHFVDR